MYPPSYLKYNFRRLKYTRLQYPIQNERHPEIIRYSEPKGVKSVRPNYLFQYFFLEFLLLPHSPKRRERCRQPPVHPCPRNQPQR